MMSGTLLPGRNLPNPRELCTAKGVDERLATTVRELLETLDSITGGRVVTSIEDMFSGRNRFVVSKSSNIPGKAVVETPGLVYGSPDTTVTRVAMVMTLTESAIELAGAIGADVIIAHHPIADAANSGGVPLKNYLDLYGICAIELHEAFHGLHPGIPFLHGHKAFRVDVAYGGIPGNIMFVGKALDEVKTVGDLLRRLGEFMGLAQEARMLEAERNIRGCDVVAETSLAAQPAVLSGTEDSPVGTVLHIFPHTGFTPEHLEKALSEHPEIDTIVASISRVGTDHPLVQKAAERKLNFVVGNTHALELYENWVPLASALKQALSPLDIVLFRERMSAIPLRSIGNEALRSYGRDMAERFLLPRKK